MPGKQRPYRVLYHPLVVDRDIPVLPAKMKARIKLAIEQRLTTQPQHYGKPLRYSLKGHRRLRVGDWRVVYRIVARDRMVIILVICHRKEVYSTVVSRLPRD